MRKTKPPCGHNRSEIIMNAIKELYEETGKPVTHLLLHERTGIPLSELAGYTLRLYKSGLITRSEPDPKRTKVYFYCGDPDEEPIENPHNLMRWTLYLVRHGKSPREDGGWTIDDICEVIKSSSRGSVATALRRSMLAGRIRTESPDPMTMRPL